MQKTKRHIARIKVSASVHPALKNTQASPDRAYASSAFRKAQADYAAHHKKSDYCSSALRASAQREAFASAITRYAFAGTRSSWGPSSPLGQPCRKAPHPPTRLNSRSIQ